MDPSFLSSELPSASRSSLRHICDSRVFQEFPWIHGGLLAEKEYQSTNADAGQISLTQVKIWPAAASHNADALDRSSLRFFP